MRPVEEIVPLSGVRIFAMPSWQVWLGCAAWAFGIFGLGSLIFRRFSARIVEEL